MAGRSTNGQVAETIKAMDCEKLADMLNRVLTDKKYQEDLQKMIAGNIDGVLFLELLDDADLLNDLNLSPGGKGHIKRIVKKIKDGTFKLPQAVGRKLLEPDMPWCTTATPTDTSTNSGNARTTAGGGMKSAWIPADAVWPWKECKEIYVKFTNVEYLSEWTIGKGQVMNTHTILHYANTWNRKGGEKIPQFVEATKGDTADIRVSFNNDQIRKSQLGKRAQNVKLAEPTMNLDLHNGCPDDEYKKHVIIHEFGHALGLGHEHQRSSFWECIEPFTNTDKMKHDLKVTDEQFDINWGVDTSEVGPHSLEYDPDSIMHYWFKVEWLTHGYSDEQKVKGDHENGTLTEKQAKALLGVHKRSRVLAKEPSTDDIELLKEVYGGKGESPSKPKPGIEKGESPLKPKPASGIGKGESPSDAAAAPRIRSDYSDVDDEGSKASKEGPSPQPLEYYGDSSAKEIDDQVPESTEQTLMERVDNTEFGDDDWNIVCMAINSLAARWETIGTALGISVAKLAEIKANNEEASGRLRSVLREWIGQNYNMKVFERPCWRTLCKALYNQVGDNKFVMTLAKNHVGAQGKTPSRKGVPGRALGGPPSSMQPPSNSGKYLSVKELATVYNAVRDARAKWYFIGLELGIVAGDLDDIKARNRGDPEACLTDVLTKFLQLVNPRPSWKRLADAMASPAVGRGDIAEQLRGKI